MSVHVREGDLPLQSPLISSTSDIFRSLRNVRSSYYHVEPFTALRTNTCQHILNINPRPLPIPNLQVNPVPAGAGGKVAESPEGNTRPILIIASIFITSLLALLYVYTKFPHLEPHEAQHVKIPWDIEDAKQLGRVLERYKDKYFFEVLLGVMVAYIFLQTFAIPGSISLSILSGFLFPFPLALTLVCFCSATGASLCYTLSLFVGRRLVYKYFPNKAAEWALKRETSTVTIRDFYPEEAVSAYKEELSVVAWMLLEMVPEDRMLHTVPERILLSNWYEQDVSVNKHRKNLFNYILFLRMTPFLPNWFINITAPVIDVPLLPFYMGTFIGVAPPSFVAIQAGQTLYNLSASSDAWSWTSVLMLALFSILSLVPVLMQKRIKQAVE